MAAGSNSKIEIHRLWVISYQGIGNLKFENYGAPQAH